MKSSRWVLLIFAAVSLLHVAAAQGAKIDMSDPSRALGREDDVRVDAQLIQDTVSSGSPVGVTYQVQNLTSSPIALADKVCDVSFDADSQSVVVSIGSEIPKGGVMPRLITIAPGEKKTFTAGGILRVQVVGGGRSPFVRVPRAVEIKVNILRDLAPFEPLILRQAQTAAAVPLNDDQFERWLESNDTIFLNAIPVHYSAAQGNGMTSAADAAAPRPSASSVGGAF